MVVGVLACCCGFAKGFDFAGSDIMAGLFFCCGGSFGPIKGEEATVGDAEGREGPMMRGLLLLLEGRVGPISLLPGCLVISREGGAFFTLPVASTASRDGLVIS